VMDVCECELRGHLPLKSWNDNEILEVLE
jgi:hypothetical protein